MMMRLEGPSRLSRISWSGTIDITSGFFLGESFWPFMNTPEEGVSN